MWLLHYSNTAMHESCALKTWTLQVSWHTSEWMNQQESSLRRACADETKVVAPAQRTAVARDSTPSCSDGDLDENWSGSQLDIRFPHPSSRSCRHRRVIILGFLFLAAELWTLVWNQKQKKTGTLSEYWELHYASYTPEISVKAGGATHNWVSAVATWKKKKNQARTPWNVSRSF